MGFLNRSKQYLATTKRWYCPACKIRTPLEHNLVWVGYGRPMRWEKPVEFEWFTRCGYCQHRHWEESYGCPNCGCPSECPEGPEYRGTCIQMTTSERHYNYSVGVTCYDWDEQHQCPKCRTKYWISNGTC